MIFVTLGSQKFQFNRLLIEVDRLIELGIIKEDVFAQIGYSDYKPKNYIYKRFLDRDEFEKNISACDKVITHGGTGVIVASIKMGKKVIAVPRLYEFNEHVDNHQVEIISQFKTLNFIESINNIEELGNILKCIDRYSFNKYISNTNKIIEGIELFINKV